MVGAASGHRDSAGVWMSADQPGYYDDRGRWNAGATSGYYDGQGRWIARSSSTNNNANVMPMEIQARINWMERDIRTTISNGGISRPSGNRATRDLNAIRRSERMMRHDRRGNLSIRDEAAITLRLDRLSNQLRVWVRQEDQRH